MIDFQKSSIWQRTLARQPVPDEHEKQREFLRVEFLNFREKAKLLSNEIARMLPDYTVHSIEHIDALWDTAELLVPSNYEINPSEAFVLGGAFLLHDLGMALAAYPKGVEDLKEETIWIDTVHSCRKDMSTVVQGKKSKEEYEVEIEKYATEKTLRLLHARRAGDLAFTSWKDSNGHDVYLIDNVEIRNALGRVMGLIAYSHWWKVTELEERLPPSLGALSRFSSNWTIDPLKLACILRIADAMQIDDRRAPSFLRTIRNPSYLSDLHWNFQEKLFQPTLEQSRIVYTSKTPFILKEMEAWWTCFDVLKTIDYELREVDALLSLKNKQSLNAIGILSIEDTRRLSKLITTDGWQPINARIKVSNVAKLVSHIGGVQLYGNNMTVPLRELIQNASDAIRARRIIEDEKADYGDVIVRVSRDIDGLYIEVEDNGIGMSQNVLTGPFLDFGQSFWGTDLMHEEWPGLESKGYSSTGRYGIGFFSLFMWGKKIRVTTNRYDKSRADTSILEFDNGTYSPPILRNALTSEYIRNGGTKVRVWIDDSVLNALIKSDTPSRSKNKGTFTRLLESMCPSIDCNIILEEDGKYQTIISANDWINIPSSELIERLIGAGSYKDIAAQHSNLLQTIQDNMDIIKDENDTIVGRAALIPPRQYYKDSNAILQGLVTVGGFRASGVSGMFGIFLGRSTRASRDVGIPIVLKQSIVQWAQNQVEKVSKYIAEGEEQKGISSILQALQVDTGILKITNHVHGFMNYGDVKKYVLDEKYDEYILIQDAAVSNYERDNSCRISFNKNLFWTDPGMPGILQTGRSSYRFYEDWPLVSWSDTSRFYDKTLKGAVIEAISEGWGCSIDAVYEASSFSSDDEKYSACVGTVEGKEVTFDHISIIRKPK